MTVTDRRIAHLEAELARVRTSRDSLQGVVDGLRGERRRVVDVRDAVSYRGSRTGAKEAPPTRR